MTIQDVSRLLSSTARQQAIVNSTHAAISLVAMELLTNVTVSQTEVDNAQQVNCQPYYCCVVPSNLPPSIPFLPPLSLPHPHPHPQRRHPTLIVSPHPLSPSLSPSLTHCRCSTVPILPSTVQTSLPRLPFRLPHNAPPSSLTLNRMPLLMLTSWQLSMLPLTHSWHSCRKQCRQLLL